MLTRVTDMPDSEGDASTPGALATIPDSDAVIRIQHVTKRYRIYPTPQDRFRDALGWRCDFKQFDALDDVSVDIRQGEFWGIVGKNGSGKSTLLKIVAGLLQPTSGSVLCHGKVALLQLGLGFDPEQTGLENIRHSRLLQNLRSDYDEIVQFVQDFSELGDFIRYPVKTYSSGMHSRLAFATAIAGAPDILIADEVLAVGDMNFSQKCLAKMREFKEQGKTVVLVTHDIHAVKSFCDHGIWLNDGKVVSTGPAKMIAEDFRNFMIYGVISDLSSDTGPGAENAGAENTVSPGAGGQDGPGWILPKPSRRTVTKGRVEILRYRFLDWATRQAGTVLVPGQIAGLEIEFRVLQPTDIHSFAFTLHDRNGLIAVHLNSEFFGVGKFERQPGEELTARFRFDVPMLASGDYSISFGCSEGADGTLMEKFDHDSVITIEHPSSLVTQQQAGYVIVPAGAFEYAQHD